MARSDTVQTTALPGLMRQPDQVEAPSTQAAMPLEKKYLSELLDAHSGKVDLAAKSAGVNRVTLYRLMQKHGLSVERRVKQG